MWPQWWSWAYVSQQGVDFSKKISKIKMIFWFDFHRCSHDGPSIIRRHFRNKSCSFLRLSKNISYKKCGPKLIFVNEKKNLKGLNDFWHRKLTLKVRSRHPCEYLWKSNQKIISLLLICLLKSSPCWLTSTKLHHCTEVTLTSTQ